MRCAALRCDARNEADINVEIWYRRSEPGAVTGPTWACRAGYTETSEDMLASEIEKKLTIARLCLLFLEALSKTLRLGLIGTILYRYWTRFLNPRKIIAGFSC